MPAWMRACPWQLLLVVDIRKIIYILLTGTCICTEPRRSACRALQKWWSKSGAHALNSGGGLDAWQIHCYIMGTLLVHLVRGGAPCNSTSSV